MRSPFDKILFDYQIKAVLTLKNGNILCGAVGSGKSRVAIVYYLLCCDGVYIFNNTHVIETVMNNPMNLFIITTARKRDTYEWDQEIEIFSLSRDTDKCFNNISVIVDSWNNISKYKDVKDSFFIFDEQRVVGYGTWTKSFLSIAAKNRWILLSATPGDTWMDYIPVFIANGFYKNKTDFIRRHVVFNRFCRYPKVDKYLEEGKLQKLKKHILVNMDYKKQTKLESKIITIDFDKELLKTVVDFRWDPFKDEPIKDVGVLCYVARKVVNSSISRIKSIIDILKTESKIIIFYNFDYELEILRTLKDVSGLSVAEWNGHKHEEIPTKSKKWVYLVQYTAGAEGWNCTETNIIIFYSLNYSYKVMVQSAGRINRLNTNYESLFYYVFISNSFIDKAILNALKCKKNFNEHSLEKYL